MELFWFFIRITVWTLGYVDDIMLAVQRNLSVLVTKDELMDARCNFLEVLLWIQLGGYVQSWSNIPAANVLMFGSNFFLVMKYSKGEDKYCIILYTKGKWPSWQQPAHYCFGVWGNLFIGDLHTFDKNKTEICCCTRGQEKKNTCLHCCISKCASWKFLLVIALSKISS